MLLCEIRVPRYYADRTPDDRAQWLDIELTRRQLSAPSEAVAVLLQRLGPGLAELRQEIEKLHCYLGDRRTVSKADVEAIVSPSVAAGMAELGNRLQRREAPGVLRLYHDMLASGMAPHAILGYVQAVLKQGPVDVLQMLLETDVAIKTGANPELSVELLLMRLCRVFEPAGAGRGTKSVGRGRPA